MKSSLRCFNRDVGPPPYRLVLWGLQLLSSYTGRQTGLSGCSRSRRACKVQSIYFLALYKKQICRPLIWSKPAFPAFIIAATSYWPLFLPHHQPFSQGQSDLPKKGKADVTLQLTVLKACDHDHFKIHFQVLSTVLEAAIQHSLALPFCPWTSAQVSQNAPSSLQSPLHHLPAAPPPAPPDFFPVTPHPRTTGHFRHVPIPVPALLLGWCEG